MSLKQMILGKTAATALAGAADPAVVEGQGANAGEGTALDADGSAAPATFTADEVGIVCAEAVTEERTRWKTVLASEGAQTHMAVAVMLLGTDMAADEIVTNLDSLPVPVMATLEAQDTTAAPPADAQLQDTNIDVGFSNDAEELVGAGGKVEKNALSEAADKNAANLTSGGTAYQTERAGF